MDPYHNFKVNDKKWNENPTFVMKSSRLATETALRMDIRSKKKTPMTECVVFMDGLHLRVEDYTTLTLWVENPIICKMQRLTSMYIRGYRECYNISAELPGYSSQSERDKCSFWDVGNVYIYRSLF